MFTNTTREQFLKKQADALTEFDKEAALAARFPGTPHAVHAWTHGTPWATYEVPKLEDAIEPLRAMAPLFVPCAVVRASCTSIDAVETLRDEYRRHYDEKGAAYEFTGPHIACETFGRGNHSAKIHAFIRLTDGTVGRVTFKHPILSQPPAALSIHSRVTFDQYGDVRTATHELPSVGEDYRVKYGGGSLESAHFVLIFAEPANFFNALTGRL